MDGFFVFFYFIPISIVFIVIIGICLLYFLMSIRQLAAGYKEKSFNKKNGGWITLVAVILISTAATYYYWKLCFLY
jgi:hypothetical protein